MLVIEDVRTTEASFPHVALTIGSFDGVHVGHRRILEQVIAAAGAVSGTAAVLTLRPHPRLFFAPEHAPNLLTTDAKKLQLFEQAGVDVAYVLPFNAEVANLEPIRFIEEIVRARCRAEKVIVGHDFRFGKGAQGDFELLAQAADRYGFEVSQVPPLLLGGERVSSTLIRERILEGDLDDAETFLGRKYSIIGQVGGGRHVGESLGFPTANVKPDLYVVPPHGVYVAEAVVAGTRYPAAVNIGIAPTIRHEDALIEAFLLDFSGNIRGEYIEIVFHKRLRTEKKFPSRESLIEQIRRDVEAVREYLGRPVP